MPQRSEAELITAVGPKGPAPIWVLGSGVSCGATTHRGVDGTSALVSQLRVLARRVFPAEIATIEESIERLTPAGQYQHLCEKLIPDYRPDVRQLLRAAVLNALDPAIPTDAHDSLLERTEALRASVGTWVSPPSPIDGKYAWAMRPGLLSLARFIADHPRPLGHIIFTTNFDPLISVAFTNAAYPHVRIVIDRDYPLSHVGSGVPIVCHVHGHWQDGEMLNRVEELNPAIRNELVESLKKQMSGRKIVVIGYGGWADCIMDALRGALAADSNTEVLWSFFDNEDETTIKDLLTHSQRRDQIKFFHNVNADTFFPRLHAELGQDPRRLKLRHARAKFAAMRKEIAKLEREGEELRTAHSAMAYRLKHAETELRSTLESKQPEGDLIVLAKSPVAFDGNTEPLVAHGSASSANRNPETRGSRISASWIVFLLVVVAAGLYAALALGKLQWPG